MKSFVLGDIHGNIKALHQVIERSRINKDTDELIFLGDVCDGWYWTRECIDELLTFKNLKLIWDRDLWRSFAPKGVHPVIHSGQDTRVERIFLGHTTVQTDPYVFPPPEKRNNVWNLDTGAGYTGKLTIMDVETEDYWQSEPCIQLYPGEYSLREL